MSSALQRTGRRLSAIRTGFLKLAESYGAFGKRIEKEEEILPALQWAREQQTPVVLEFMIATEEIVLPMVKSGNPMSEMILK